jgi:hypothetical protein
VGSNAVQAKWIRLSLALFKSFCKVMSELLAIKMTESFGVILSWLILNLRLRKFRCLAWDEFLMDWQLRLILTNKLVSEILALLGKYKAIILKSRVLLIHDLVWITLWYHLMIV